MIQRRTLVNGTVMGVGLLTALTLAGVLSARNTPPKPAALPPALETDTRIASQPELQQALLRPDDLPKPYVAASKATVRRVPPATERCGTLLDPASLVRDASARVLPHPDATDQAAAQLEGPTQLNQLLTTFAGDGAVQTLDELRRVGNQCRDFNARLEDGTPVRVTSTIVRDDGITYSIKLTLTGGGRTTAGFLTLGRVGQVLSVLQQLGPVDAVAAVDPLKLVDLTLSRLTRPGKATG